MPISTIWSQAWQKFWNKNWLVGLLLALAIFLFSLIPVVGIIVSFIIGVALNYYGLQVWRSDSPVEFSQVFPPLIAYVKILVGLVVVGLIPGLILLIVYLTDGGLSVTASFVLGALLLLFLMVVFYFFSYFVLERDAGIGEALRGALAILLQNPGKSILFILTLLLVHFLGILALGVGTLLTTPLASIGGAGFYLTHRLDATSPKLT
ncbi:MAG: hypothetical protein ABDH91_04950 [Bacteroidia bacterium]